MIGDNHRTFDLPEFVYPFNFSVHYTSQSCECEKEIEAFRYHLARFTNTNVLVFF